MAYSKCSRAHVLGSGTSFSWTLKLIGFHGNRWRWRPYIRATGSTSHRTLTVVCYGGIRCQCWRYCDCRVWRHTGAVHATSVGSDIRIRMQVWDMVMVCVGCMAVLKQT